MAAAITLLMATLAVLPRQTQDPRIDTATAQRMWQREELLRQEMTRLWQEVEKIRSLEEAPFRSMFQKGLLWATAAALLAELCWLAWQRKLVSSSKQEDDLKGEQDLNREWDGAKDLAESAISPAQELPDPCRNLKHLVHDLLYISREFSRRTFMPEFYPASGTDGSHESWSILENRILYQLLVLLRPPPGLSFILEQDTLRQQSQRCADIRVVLECTCSMEHLMGYSFCFVHCQGNQLLQDHRPLFLETLCTGSYLNVKQISIWVENLLLSAWLRLPQWPRRCLTPLPCSRCCRFLVSSPSEGQSCTEMFFAVQESRTGSFLVLE